ncbi:MAG: hypothetical protein V4693_04545 [Pseudomonadota bacterium]
MAAGDDFRPGHLRQAGRPELKVFLAVGFEHVGDAQVIGTGKLEVFGDVASRVDEDCQAFAAAEQVGVMAQSLVLTRWKNMIAPGQAACVAALASR